MRTVRKPATRRASAARLSSVERRFAHQRRGDGTGKVEFANASGTVQQKRVRQAGAQCLYAAPIIGLPRVPRVD